MREGVGKTGKRDNEEPSGNTTKPYGGYCKIEDLAGNAPSSSDAMGSLSPVTTNPVVKSPMPRQGGERVPYGD